ncbi:hypothetical protein ACFFMP_03350 [Pseudoroseomonas cervicalis]|uniref:Uncharacterized protein n=1 Tax=Pseudoroseomonas cervicalis ATCC 49957 TaxID=525371 RepID=D5RPE0_9PROT|nr:hypothetical protein [Pseudoroseomonas cervicalis]EFH10829.1 hypothetical protein HMPREF0731_2951 [Pseudoroseomonas cervicalis ATCC 49957]
MRIAAAILGAGLVLGLGLTPSEAQSPEPPHAWAFGSWTGGYFPAADTQGPRCTGQPSVIITRDVVMRSNPLDVPYRQRMIETATAQPNGLLIRLTPVTPPGARNVPPGVGFGCDGDPNLLRIERRGDGEIVFPNCAEFPAPLKRCTN